MYDVDGNGVIDIQEMTKIVQVGYVVKYFWKVIMFLYHALKIVPTGP